MIGTNWIDPMALEHGNSHRVLVHSRELYDADFNAECIAEGVLLPVHDGQRTATVALWNGYQDHFYSGEVRDIIAVMPLPSPPPRTR